MAKSKAVESVSKEEIGSVEEIVNTPTKLKFTVKKNHTLPLLKPQLEVPFYVRLEGKHYLGKDIKQMVAGKKMEPAELIEVIELESGELQQLIVPAVLKGILDDEFETDENPETYVGKCFMITKHKKAAGKGYHQFSVAEIDMG